LDNIYNGNDTLMIKSVDYQNNYIYNWIYIL